jgi:hypothetical protein
MTPAQIEEVWSMLDRHHLASVARSGPEPVFAAISGAHLYGFASLDSDVDLRGAFLHSPRDLLGLFPPAETISIDDQTAIDLDWVAHDIRKFSRLMTRHNGSVLEQLFSPLVVLGGPEHEELRELGRGCITRPTARHYQGFASARRKRLREPKPSVKHLLYAYRVLLTGIHLMRSGEVVANLQVLNEHFRLREVDELIARKRASAESLPLDAGDLARFEPLLEQLETTLVEAHDRSSLPLEPTSTDALNDFVVRLRFSRMR